MQSTGQRMTGLQTVSQGRSQSGCLGCDLRGVTRGVGHGFSNLPVPLPLQTSGWGQQWLQMWPLSNNHCLHHAQDTEQDDSAFQQVSRWLTPESHSSTNLRMKN